MMFSDKVCYPWTIYYENKPSDIEQETATVTFLSYLYLSSYMELSVPDDMTVFNAIVRVQKMKSLLILF